MRFLVPIKRAVKLLLMRILRVVYQWGGIDTRHISQEIIRLSSVPIGVKIAWDVVDRPQYGYGVYRAAQEAKALGLGTISVIEFGVAGGKGLLALERMASAISAELNIRIDVFGFDGGSGMPKPLDYRDLPSVWKEGFFAMNVEQLQERLTQSRLIIGNISDTVPSFVAKYQPAPIGFVAFDLDYYSSTVQAFGLFGGASDAYLPRVFCYFDDTIGDDWEIHSPYTGELLAIEEFNRQGPLKKIAKINGLSFKRRIPRRWNEKMYVLHHFEHPLYTQHIYPNKDWQMELRES